MSAQEEQYSLLLEMISQIQKAVEQGRLEDSQIHVTNKWEDMLGRKVLVGKSIQIQADISVPPTDSASKYNAATLSEKSHKEELEEKIIEMVKFYSVGFLNSIINQGNEISYTGKDDTLLWHRQKSTVMGKSMVIGSKTYTTEELFNEYIEKVHS